MFQLVALEMATEKLSVSLSKSSVQFIENFKSTYHLRSRSQVIEKAVNLLKERELEDAYREANEEIDSDWEVTVRDGLSDEAW